MVAILGVPFLSRCGDDFPRCLRGVLHGLYLVGRGYAVESFYLGFAAVHLVIIGTGLFLLRQARRAVE